MPGSDDKPLTTSQAKRLERARRRLDEAEIEWARLIRRYGVAASARALGLSRRSILERVRAIEARSDDEEDGTAVREVIRDRNPSVADVRARSRRTRATKERRSPSE